MKEKGEEKKREGRELEMMYTDRQGTHCDVTEHLLVRVYVRTFCFFEHVGGRTVEDKDLKSGVKDVHITLGERGGGQRHFLHSHCSLA